MTPAAAMAAGSDYLVIGRPITKAADPLQALRNIHLELGEKQ
jgi:orotidine-5'-phosphate decarboxylase